MSSLLRDALNGLATVGLIAACVASIALPLELIRRLSQTRKRRAIRTYARRLSRLLRTRYGEQEKYTPTQVKRMMKEWGYSTAYDSYGLAMFCDYAGFTNYHRSIGKSCNYEAMRREISKYLFHADITFSISDVIAAKIDSDRPRSHDQDNGGDWGEHHIYYPDHDHHCGGHDGDQGGCDY